MPHGADFFSPVGSLLPCQFPFLSWRKRMEDLSIQRTSEATAKYMITLESVSVQNKKKTARTEIKETLTFKKHQI